MANSGGTTTKVQWSSDLCVPILRIRASRRPTIAVLGDSSMRRTRALIGVIALLGSLGAFAAPTAGAAPTENGREWREVAATTGLSWSEVASVCPTDGVTACSGSVGGRDLTGWTRASAPQVRDQIIDHRLETGKVCSQRKCRLVQVERTIDLNLHCMHPRLRPAIMFGDKSTRIGPIGLHIVSSAR